MHHFAAGHPFQIGPAYTIAVARHFHIDRSNAVHWNHDGVRAFQINAGPERTGPEQLRAGFVPDNNRGTRSSLIVKEEAEEKDAGTTAWSCQPNAKHSRRRRICLGARGNERYRLDPIGRALHRARLCILPKVDPSVAANGSGDGSASVSGNSWVESERLLREKSSRHQDQP